MNRGSSQNTSFRPQSQAFRRSGVAWRAPGAHIWASPHPQASVLAVSDGFRDFVLEQLRGLRGVTVRRMFGGAGLYKDGLIFAILDDDQVFFKVDDESRPQYQKAGSRGFQP